MADKFIQFQFTVLGEVQVNQAFRSVNLSLINFKPVWEKISKRVYFAVRKTFSSEGTYAGKAWTPLNEAYARHKRRVWGKRKILVASGEMRRSLIGPSHAHSVRSMSRDTLMMGSENVLWVYHHGGTRTGIPSRRIYDFTREDKNKMGREMGAHIQKAWRSGRA